MTETDEIARILAAHRPACAGEDAFDDLVERFLNWLADRDMMLDWRRFKAAVYGWEGSG